MIDLDQATKRLLINFPFYGLFLLSISRKFSNEVKTAEARINGINYEILVNKEFWESIDTDEGRLNLLLHELLHICLKHVEHFDRFPDRNLYNIAADLEVSCYIDIITINGENRGYTIDKFPDFKWRAGIAYYYEKLSKIKNNQNDLSSSNDSILGSENSLLDDHDSWEKLKELPDAVKQLIKNQLNTILKQTAEQISKIRGSIPGELSEIINELFKQKPAIFNWRSYFRRMLGTIIDIDIKKTRKKESNRFPDASGLKHKRKSNIFLVIDTSGSVSDKDAIDFFSEINHIYKSGARITICECDSRVQRIYEYTGKWDGKFQGRGGTRMQDAIIEFNKRRRDYQTIIFFTDGYIEDCIIPIMGQSMWIITSDGDHHRQFPGKTLYIPKEQ